MLASDTHLAMSHGYRPASSQKCLASDTQPSCGALATDQLAVRSAVITVILYIVNRPATGQTFSWWFTIASSEKVAIELSILFVIILRNKGCELKYLA